MKDLSEERAGPSTDQRVTVSAGVPRPTDGRREARDNIARLWRFRERSAGTRVLRSRIVREGAI